MSGVTARHPEPENCHEPSLSSSAYPTDNFPDVPFGPYATGAFVNSPLTRRESPSGFAFCNSAGSSSSVKPW